MKYTIVINYIGKKGGGTLDAFEMAKALVEKGNVVIPIISKQIQNRSLWNTIEFEKVIEIDTYNTKSEFLYRSLTFKRKISRVIKRELNGYNVDISYSPMVTFWTNRINKVVRAKKNITVCHDLKPHSGEKWINTYIAKKQYNADLVIVHSKKFLQEAKDIFGNAAYIPLGRHNIYKSLKKKSCISYPKDKINYLFFGRIEDYKGIDILIEAYLKLQNLYKDITLNIVGSGDFTKYNSRFSEIKNSNLINRFVEDEEVESVFTGKNLVCVCPYIDATQSGVVLLAYDYGIPVIATKTGGLEEQVFNEETGYLIEPKNVEELFKKMELFIKEPKIINHMQNNIKDYLNCIGWDKSAETLMQIISSVI